MATLSPAGKMRRVFEFLLGLRDDRVLAALSACGFGASDRLQGWKLLQTLALTQSTLVVVPPTTTLSELDEWRHKWMRVARVSLEHSFPSIHAQLFRGLDSSDPAITVVPAFLARFTKLERARDATSKSAIEKLNQRGLSRERVQEAERLLQIFVHPRKIELPDLELRRAEIAKAERELWDYYLEWSQIAQAVIKERRLLELLGYREGQPTPDDESAPQGEAAVKSDAKLTRKRKTHSRSPRRSTRAVTDTSRR